MSDQANSHDFPAKCYPFTIEAFHTETKAVVWSVQVEAPAAGTKGLVYIPPIAKQLGHPVGIRLRFADGTVEESPEPTR